MKSKKSEVCWETSLAMPQPALSKQLRSLRLGHFGHTAHGRGLGFGLRTTDARPWAPPPALALGRCMPMKTTTDPCALSAEF